MDFSDKKVTEITCHTRGIFFLNENIRTILDVGGQDSKVINLDNVGNVFNFIMNDKCAAGTGRFLEITSNLLGSDISNIDKLASGNEPVNISSMCTVFAESEVISLIGTGRKKEDIAFAIVDSIVSKVATICGKHSTAQNYFLTGGLCNCEYIVNSLSEKLGSQVKTKDSARFAGAIGAALLAKNLK